MASSTISVTLPEPLTAFVEARVETGSYGTPNEYIQELILDDRDRRVARLEDRLLANMESKPIKVTAEEWEDPDLMNILRKKLEPAA
jgi:antitoxin ParD1/3/4